jgi:D-alanyl-D-alanine carboxypeptidase/D-alanyl-D-alanine-endopeptidase (penicillin-binding protein 4)
MAVLTLSACSGNGKKASTDSPHKPRTAVSAVDTALVSRLKKFGNSLRPKGNFGFYVFDLTADRPVYGVNEQQPQSSASCLKLLSGVAGLHLLGTKYIYSTSIYTRGKLEGDTLRGDVGFRAGLDPQLQAPDLAMFAKALRRKGIKSFDGKLYMDLTISDPVQSEEHWYPWDLTFPQYGLLYKGSDRIEKELKSALRSQGVAVKDSQVVLGSVPVGSHCIFRFLRSIDRVTQRMWKHSSNTQATAMLYTIGHKVDPKGDPTMAGVRYLRTFLRDSLGLRDTSLVVHDGCGLCTHNHLTPIALTTILRYGYHHKAIYRLLTTQLSLSGVDGTLRRELSNAKLRGRIRAKTGTLSHPYGISSLAGYCKGSNGHLLAFAIMDTDMSVLDARVLQQKLCEALVE